MQTRDQRIKKIAQIIAPVFCLDCNKCHRSNVDSDDCDYIMMSRRLVDKGCVMIEDISSDICDCINKYKKI